MTTRSTTRAVTRSTTRGTTSSKSGGSFEPAAPIFTVQPTNESAVEGTDATFISLASGHPSPTYQWEVNDGGGWDTLSGATSRILTLTDVTLAMDGYQYRNVATNDEGTDTSDEVTLTVTAAPVDAWILATGNWNNAGVWTPDGLWNSGSISYASHLLTMDYQSRLVAEGHAALSSDAYNLVAEVFQAAEDNGVGVTSGWLFGSVVNVADRELQINLVDTKPSLIPVDTLHTDTTLGVAMLGIRADGTGDEGYITDDNSGLFDDSPDYSVLMIMNYTGDPSGTAPFLFEQHTGPTDGNIACYGQASGGIQYIDRPSTTAYFPGGAPGGSATAREYQVDPLIGWWHFNDSGEFEMIHAGGESSGFQTCGSDPSGKPLVLANPGSSAYAGDVGFAVFIRFDGVLDATAHQDILDRILRKWNHLGLSIGIIGNSVTISGVSDPELTWPRKVQRWGVYNSALVSRRAQGARRLPFFAPTGYTLPGAPSDAAIAGMPVNVLEKYRFNMIVNDDQQNMIASGQNFTNWLHCHNAIVGYFDALNDPGVMRAVMCTQMAYPPYESAPDCSPVDYAYVAMYRAPFRDISILTRAATLSDFNNIPTAIADVYANENLGWDVADDGNAPDPINDYPYGDASHFALYPAGVGPDVDPQHWSDAGHAYHFTNTYLPAIEEARDL